jgi:hypothetical protein
MPDHPTNAILIVWLLNVVDKDHAEPSNQGKLDWQENVCYLDQVLFRGALADKAEVDVIEHNVNEEAIFEKRVNHGGVFTARAVIKHNADVVKSVDSLQIRVDNLLWINKKLGENYGHHDHEPVSEK